MTDGVARRRSPDAYLPAWSPAAAGSTLLPGQFDGGHAQPR